MAIKWGYTSIQQTDRGSWKKGDHEDLPKNPGIVFDTPQEAFEQARKDYPAAYMRNNLYRFFLQWEEVPDRKSDSEATWIINVKSDVMTKHRSNTYPREYSYLEALALVNYGNQTKATMHYSMERID